MFACEQDGKSGPGREYPLGVMARSDSDPPRRNGKPSNGTDPARPAEFDRFTALTEKLLQVPKKELDALRKKKR